VELLVKHQFLLIKPQVTSIKVEPVQESIKLAPIQVYIKPDQVQGYIQVEVESIKLAAQEPTKLETQ
jgi:hypothetical protein